MVQNAIDQGLDVEGSQVLLNTAVSNTPIEPPKSSNTSNL
jgi:hypothetical protein